MTAANHPPGAAAPDALIKVWYRFVPREGWLLCDTEGIWAVQLTDGTARIANIPMLVEEVAEGDVVAYTTAPDGLNWVTECVQWSGNCTVRVLPVRDGPIGPSVQAVHDLFAPYGVGAEGYSADLPLVAMTVPPDCDVPAVKALLVRGERDGWWHYEESCIGDAWRQA